MYKNDGQMGIGVNVAAAIDRVALDTLSWGDADGIGGTSRAGYVGLKDTSIRGVTVSGPVALDVETVRTGETSGTYAIGTKYIHVGFDNLDVGVDEIDTTAVIGDKKNFSGDTGVLGTLYLKELNLNVTGHLDLYNETAGDVATLRFGVAIPTLTLDTLSWGDADGYAGATGFGGVGLRNLAIRNLNVAGEATVDEATIQAGEDGISLLPVGTVFVRIGLSKLDLSMESLDTDIALGNRKDNLNQVLGSVYLGDLKMSMTGRVDIHTPSASTQGIVLDLDAKFPQLTMSALSWGDADGFSSHPNAGYVGLRNTEIKGLEVAGRVGIDVATADSSEQASRMSPSFVRITLGSVNADTMPTIGNGGLFIGIKYFGTDMILDSIKTLDSPSRKSLGSLYFSGIEISVKGKINIGAH